MSGLAAVVKRPFFWNDALSFLYSFFLRFFLIVLLKFSSKIKKDVSLPFTHVFYLSRVILCKISLLFSCAAQTEYSQ